MSKFVFDQNIFQKKFVQQDGLRNRAKSIMAGCDSICPNNTDSANVYKGYTSTELLADTLHNVFGEVLSTKKATSVDTDLKNKMIEQLDCNNDPKLQSVFADLIDSIYFDTSDESHSVSPSLLRYLPASKQKDFGKLIYDVLLSDKTKAELKKIICDDANPIDDMVNIAYGQLNVLQPLSSDQEYSRLFNEDLADLFDIMNADFQAALSNPTDAMSELEFLLAYYLFIYLSQLALRFDIDLNSQSGHSAQATYPMFKGAKEGVSEDRECIVNGWKRVEKKTQKVFNHWIVLNMLNCHKNDTPYLTYSEIFKIYELNIEERSAMDSAIDYIIYQYTVAHSYSTDTAGVSVDFSEIDYPQESDAVQQFKKKIKYLYACVTHQLDNKEQRHSVATYAAGNYNHILKMRFVKSWGSLGQMMIISNDDLITMISICQRTATDKMVPDRGIQISDLFEEFRKRGLCMDGKTKQYVIDYLIEINLIDSKCDSEEAQYVKQIQ